MDKKKEFKEEKVGADGLTKKERRALKVQARQTDDNKAELKNIKTNPVPNICQNIDSNKQKNTEVGEKKKEDKEDLHPVITAVDLAAKNCEDGLNAKEKRKLEWKKRLAEEKNQLNKSDSAGDSQGLSKAEQKAKRREIQEAQRLAKVKVVLEIPKTANRETDVKKVNSKISSKPKLQTNKLKEPHVHNVSRCKKSLHASKVQLLNHLYLGDSNSNELGDSVCRPNVHPAFIELGIQYSMMTIIGSNARCVSVLSALKTLITDLKSPPQEDFCRYLESVLQNCTHYLQKCRPMAVSMVNALRLFKLQLTQIDENIPDDDKKHKLLEFINTYIKDEIFTAGTAISMKVLEKIADGNIILTCGCSSLIQKILIDAFGAGKQFKVIIVDSRPLLEGKEMLRRLSGAGIECNYIFMNALTHVMPIVTKVLLGTHALLVNGYVKSRTGTAYVAMVGQAYNKPVLVCCETYKFTEMVQVDSLVCNEIGDPDRLLSTFNNPSPLNIWKKKSKLTPLHLLYDVTPSDLVTAVVTELAILPSTSVPAVLRIKPIEI